jgi:hypothetical protein
MEDFKRQFINVAYSEFGIKAIESINFEQAFAILDKMQALRIHDVVGRSEQLFCEEHTPKVRYDWQKGNCLTCAKTLEAKQLPTTVGRLAQCDY